MTSIVYGASFTSLLISSSDPGHDGIGDHGYGVSDGKSKGALCPYHRLRTAECYANFAKDCRFGVN